MNDEGWIIDTTIGARFPAWTRGNAADVLPDPISPLMWTFYWKPSLMTGLRDAYIGFGVIDWTSSRTRSSQTCSAASAATSTTRCRSLA